jgi:hypothetical protein
MLKTISSITNALGALNYKGTWNASTNTPTLTSSVGAKGDYYVVSVAGSTNLNGETLWGVGDWAVFNGSVWQRVEGGDTINATTVSASTSVSTPVIQALSSAGGTLKNNGGTAQMQWGSGGGSNLSLEVATNINPANAAVNISPTGTGTVTINPATASTMNNVAIGGTTALAGNFRLLTAKATTTNGSTYAFQATNSADTDLMSARSDGLVTMGTAANSPYNLTTASAANMFVDSNGWVFRSTSSAKYKKDIQDSAHGLKEVLALRSVVYRQKSLGPNGEIDEKIYGGLLAENVDATGLTEFVQYAKDGTPDALHYGNMISLLVKAVQEQQLQIDELKSKI